MEYPPLTELYRENGLAEDDLRGKRKLLESKFGFEVIKLLGDSEALPIYEWMYQTLSEEIKG